jgi:Holliday junction DNA helicase RuvA
MIGTLRGLVTRKVDGAAIIECSGVGYLVTLSTHSLAKLAVGNEAFVDVHTHVREDQIALFGFADAFEKDVFTLLVSVSGVGPKMAMNVLSGMPADALVQAIATENLAVLTKIPGVGKKTAERLLLELKSAVKTLGAAPLAASDQPALPRTLAGVHAELVSALTNLGYKAVQVEPVAEKVLKEHAGASFEQLVREALLRLR